MYYIMTNSPQLLQIELFEEEAVMKISLVLLVSFCILAVTFGHPSVDGGNDAANSKPERKHETEVEHEVPEHVKKMFIRKADRTLLQRQKQILPLLYHMNQESLVPEHIEIAKTFSPFTTENRNLYMKDGVVEKFHQMWKYAPLAKGAIFSIFDANHLPQAMALSKLLYHAKDYDVFYKTAAWARMNVNEGMFVYALYVAVVHRADTKGVMLPPIYEVSPHLFFSADVINKVQYYKQIHETKQHDQDKGYTGYTVDSDYVSRHSNMDREQTSLAYYLQDVGMNAFFYDFHINFPFWMNGTEFGWSSIPRGVLYYTFYQTIWARYQLERDSFGMDDVEYLNWDLPVVTPYHSNLVYPNGVAFPNRPKFAKLHEYFYNYGQSRWASSTYGFSYMYVNDLERRIVDAIESGAIWSEEKGEMVKLESDEFLNVLGNLIEGNRDSPNFHYYGSIWFFARHLLGYSTQQLDMNETVPSALEHFETTLRDPVFYQLVKKLVVIPYQRYLQRIPPYTEEELVFPGVEITEVQMGTLMTYNETFHSNLINSVYYKPHERYGDFQARVRQSRLNHVPFMYKMHVKSDKAQKASIRVFIGPKYVRERSSTGIGENRLHFAEFDQFVVDLSVGDNVITRKSSDNMFYAPDKMGFHELYEKTVAALDGHGDFNIDLRQNLYGFPRRFRLPRGSEDGRPYQFFFAVYPHSEQSIQHTHKLEMFMVDNHSWSYPMDRFIKFNRMWEQIPNFHIEEFKIHHRE